MKQARKVLCIIGVGLISVLLAVSTVYACCGMTPEITDDPIEPGCPCEEVTISGTVKLTPDPVYMPEAPVVTVEVTDPDGNVVTITATVSNLQEFPEGGPYEYATWDFSATYTPPKPGTYTYTKTATNTFGSNSDSESGEFTVEDCPLQVEIDIKPGSCPNPFNAKSKGNVPVAIVGSADVDVTTIDPASIKLEGVAPLRWSIEDVTEPGGYDPEDCFDCFEEPAPITLPDGTVVKYSGDGIPDLVMQFDTQALAAAMRPAVRDECVVLTLKGVTSDGCNSIVGSDSVIIRTKIK